MLALQESSGFEVMKEDELYYINGGSGSSTGISISVTYTNITNWDVHVAVTTEKNTYTVGASVSTKNGTIQGGLYATCTPNC